MLVVMDSFSAADVASPEVLPVSGEFLIGQATLFAAFLAFAAFASFALARLSRKTGTDGSGGNSSPQVPAPAVTPTSPQRSTHRWTIAGVVVAVLGLVVTAVQLAHGW
ncbi:hypothetical protein [Streptomyces hirsutus]|uniref:hypothetical protein n=1 Tax=Streptomyces hirsutus TaxID=35620 RepID=UPI0033AE3971